NGDGTFVRETANYGVGRGSSGLFAADLDGDGDLDVTTANTYDHNVSMLRNLSNPINCLSSKGNMNADAGFSPADVVLLLNCVFLTLGNCLHCFSDVNCDGNLSPADVVLELNAVFLAAPFPC
ncbi:MAG: hypothetical protein ACRECJ_04960, partial [Limisphaerales bacterium]